ncbi:MAG: hypothetical protein ACYDAZ_03770 [Thermoplasmataceae archaeon]
MKPQGEPCDRKGQARFEAEGSGVIQTFTLQFSNPSANYLRPSVAAAVSTGVDVIYTSLACAILAFLVSLVYLIFAFINPPRRLKGKELLFPEIGLILLVMTLGLYYAGVSYAYNAFISSSSSPSNRYTSSFSPLYGTDLLILALALNIVYVLLSLTSWKKTAI